MRIVFFDLETTGVGDKDRLCQLAFKIKGDGAGFVSLYKPPVPISIEASSITGITNKMVENLEIFEGSLTYQKFKEIIESPETIGVAHNSRFDVAFLKKEGILPQKTICTLKLTHHLDKKAELPKHTLQYLRHYYGMEIDASPHDAMGDVLVLEQLFEIYENKLDIEQMLEISSRPIFLKKMPFGKHKGQPFSLVPPDYLHWIKENVEMSEDLKYTINKWIQFYEKNEIHNKR